MRPVPSPVCSLFTLCDGDFGSEYKKKKKKPGNLSFSRIELNIIQLRSTRGSNFDFEIFKKKISAVRADRTLFARLAVVAQSRSLDMRSVLDYELGPVPWSLATPDGGLVKTDKSCLLHLLESGTQPVEDVPPMAALILDGMAVLQTTRPTGDTFSHLADQVFRYATQGLISGGRVELVVDRCLPLSIKSSERERRAAAGMLRVKINQPDQRLPNWKKFLAVSDNKIALNHFFTQWTSPRYAKKLHNCRGNCCNVLTSTKGQTVSSMAVPELECHQEEADTCLFLHAQHADSSRSAVVIIRSPDTDVAVIGCSLAAQIPAQVLLHTGTKERRRYISLSSVAARLGNGVCQALPGLHAFTGCDSTDAFSGRGKKAAFLAGKVDAMQLLGQHFEVSDELVVLCEQFVACLYNKPDVDEINELRYQLF